MTEIELGWHYLTDVLLSLRKSKTLAERALAQVDNTRFFAVSSVESNSLALIVKHLAGNQRSRWTDFLTSDGEKPDRERDREFELEERDSRESLMAEWEAGWTLVLESISSLRPDDLLREVTLRGEAHTALEAIDRQLVHYSHHVGQIVFLAKQWTGLAWKSLSIPKGRSKELEVSEDGSVSEPQPGS